MSRRDKRPPRTKSADELMAELQRNPDFVARQKLQDDVRQENVESYKNAASALLAELATVGFDVEVVGGLRRSGTYRAAVPVLLRWLPHVQDAALKEDIVRTLSVPWAAEAAPRLVAEFEQTDDSEGGLRWAIGNALEVLANEEIADEMIRLATDRRYGKAREMVVLGLGRLKTLRAIDILIELLEDDEVVGHAVMALGRLRALSARSQIERLLHYPKAWVRDEVRKALASIDA